MVNIKYEYVSVEEYLNLKFEKLTLETLLKIGISFTKGFLSQILSIKTSHFASAQKQNPLKLKIFSLKYQTKYL